ncbi:phage head closure protein [Anaerosinus massiliensis]|uniref:phage head closure protein n=1 Tax=Massilibacillus massiliensis TaxID=1806837 RepID=UPI0018FEB5C1|nr:phage head closure protein [Massilibacillus massiliensis]
MNAGTLDRKITFYRYEDVENEVGANEQKPVKAFSTWARIEPLRGREYYEAQRVKEVDSFKITTRYRKGVTDDMIIRYGEQQYEIKTVTDPYMRHERLELYCTIKSRGAAANG